MLVKGYDDGRAEMSQIMLRLHWKRLRVHTLAADHASVGVTECGERSPVAHWMQLWSPSEELRLDLHEHSGEVLDLIRGVEGHHPRQD